MRGWLLPLVAGAVLALAAVAAGASPPPSYTSGMVAVASGHWGKTAWTLSARESNGMFCSAVSLDGTPLGASCGGIDPTTRSRLLMFGTSWSSREPVAVVRGFVVMKATKVVITLADGQKIRTATIPPPAHLSRDIGFFIAQFPCETAPKSAVGLDAGGRVVASWPPAGMPPFPTSPHPPSCAALR